MYMPGVTTHLVPFSMYVHIPSGFNNYILQDFSNSRGDIHWAALMLTEILKTLKFKFDYHSPELYN